MPEIDLKQQRRLRRRSRGPLPNESALVNGLLIGLTAVAAGSLVVGAFALLDQKSSISYAYVAPSVPPALGGLMNRPVDVPVDERFFREARDPRDFSPAVFSVSAPAVDKAKESGNKDKGKSKDKGKGEVKGHPGTPGTNSPDVVPVASVPLVEPQVLPSLPAGVVPTPHEVTQALAPAQEAAVATVKDVAPSLAPVAQEVLTTVNDVINGVEELLPPLGLLK